MQRISGAEILVVDPNPTLKKTVEFLARIGISALFTAEDLAVIRENKILKKRGKEPKMSRRKFLAKSLGLLIIGNIAYPLIPSIIVSPTAVRGKIGPMREALLNTQEGIFRTLLPIIIDARNAIIAEKLEGVIAPMLKRELGRKPRIAIQVGLMHSGIKMYLQDPIKRRKALIRLRKRIQSGLKKQQLHKSFRVRWDKRTKNFCIEEIKTPVKPLISEKPITRRELFKRVAHRIRKRK
jgi:hypothetical protein